MTRDVYKYTQKSFILFYGISVEIKINIILSKHNPFENDLIGQMGSCILRLTIKMYVNVCKNIKYIHDIDVCDTK